jgi:hypothetical protein
MNQKPNLTQPKTKKKVFKQTLIILRIWDSQNVTGTHIVVASNWAETLKVGQVWW